MTVCLLCHSVLIYYDLYCLTCSVQFVSVFI